MQQHIRVAVAQQMSVVRNADATQLKRAAFGQLVSVVSQADPKRGRISLRKNVWRTAVPANLSYPTHAPGKRQ